MTLSMQVGLDPSDIVSDGDQLPPSQKGTEPPTFGPCLLWPSGCMDQYATWYEGGPWPRPHCASWDPDPLQVGCLVGWGLTALLTQNRSYRACRFVGIFYSKL